MGFGRFQVPQAPRAKGHSGVRTRQLVVVGRLVRHAAEPGRRAERRLRVRLVALAARPLRTAILGFVRAAIALLVLALGTTGTVAAATERRPTLSLVVSTPLVVRGSGFTAGERVRITLMSPHPTRATSRTASRAGTFTARISLTPILCQRTRSIVAVGDHGSRAELKLARDNCWPPPPLRPAT